MHTLLLFLWMSAPSDLGGKFAEIAAEAKGRTGVAAMLLENGEIASLHGQDRFPMQSVYKFPIAMAVLHEVDRGTLRLDQTVQVVKSELVPPELHSPLRDEHPDGATLPLREIVRYAVSESDGTASDVLLRLAGGGAGVMRYLHGIGIQGVTVETTEMTMSRGSMVQYRNWAQPEAMLALLRAFHMGRGLSPSSRKLLEEMMVHTGTGPKRLRGLLPLGTVVAHKTGTSGTDAGLTRATNDVGIITLPGGRHIAIAVFVSDSPASVEAREGAIAKIAKAAWDHWR